MKFLQTTDEFFQHLSNKSYVVAVSQYAVGFVRETSYRSCEYSFYDVRGFTMANSYLNCQGISVIDVVLKIQREVKNQVFPDYPTVTFILADDMREFFSILNSSLKSRESIQDYKATQITL